MMNFIIGVIVGSAIAVLTVGIMFGASKTERTHINDTTGDSDNER